MTKGLTWAALALALTTVAMPVQADRDDRRDDRRSARYEKDRDSRYRNTRYDHDSRSKTRVVRSRTVVQAPRIVFRSEPRWRTVPGTRVYVVNRAYTNVGYDVFRFGNTYYLYNDGSWFAAPTWRGPFYLIDDGDVPVAFHRVPRSEWRSYPRGWLNVNVGRSY